MSGKFINTSHKLTIDSLVDGFKKKLDNPYYIFSDRKATPTTYLNQNTTKSTLDEGSRLLYAPLGDQSPLKYNKINNAFLYGIEKMITDLENGEWGLESNPIEGEAIVLPNTFIPIPEDYFYIDYLNKKILFKVTSVTTDTLENGANFYKLSYKLDQYDYTMLDKQIVDEFNMIISTDGTQFNSVIRTNDYNFIEEMDSVLIRLKEYYVNLFFNSKVQTFIYTYNDTIFYDPYLIEFIIRNGLLEGTEKSIYVSHQVPINKTFAIEYDKTFFRNVETCNDKIKPIPAYAVLINDPSSLLSMRMDDYFKIDYNMSGPFVKPIPIIDLEMVSNIADKKYFDNGTDKEFMNIIIKYFLKEEYRSEVIDYIENIDYNSNITLFYNIPIIIFVLEAAIKKLLLKTPTYK